jgi:hypothetical protein
LASKSESRKKFPDEFSQVHSSNNKNNESGQEESINIPDFSMDSHTGYPVNESLPDDYQITSGDKRRSTQHVDPEDLLDAKSYSIEIKESSGVFLDML